MVKYSTKKFKIKGMFCPSCEKVIQRSIEKIKGVKEIKANYVNETGEVTFDSDITNIEEIFNAVKEKGYDCISEGKDPKYYYVTSKQIGFAFGIIGLLVIGYFLFGLLDGIPLPEISPDMGYGLLFLVGLLTGLHCVSMCGGFVVSYTARHAQEGTKAYKSHLMYGFGKTLSYTLIGAGFGLVGSIIAFTPLMRGVAGILAGIFLVIFGLNMFNVFPWLRKVRISTPAFVSRFVGTKSRQHNSPLIIGLLNGLMIACGPLQAIYIMAAGVGSAIEGAKLLFVFGLGTLPVMIGFGFLTSFISSKATHKLLKASGAIVIIFGFVMINSGLALTGSGLDTSSLITSSSISEANTTENIEFADEGYQIIRMEVTRYGWEPDKFVLKKDVPVKWIITGKEINGCNNAIQVPKLGLEFDIKQGEQIIEFTPTKEGIIPWSCWMGMIPGAFIVKEDIDLGNGVAVQEAVVEIPPQPVSSCGGSCGSPTCGSARGGACDGSCGG